MNTTNNQNQKSKRSIYLIICVSLIIGVALGYIFTQLTKEKPEEVVLPPPIEIPPDIPPIPEEVKSVFGNIVAIEDNKIKLEGQLPISHPDYLPENKIFTIIVNEQTEIIKRITKSPDQIMAEWEAFEKNPDLAEPTPFEETLISLNDLPLGVEIVVMTIDNMRERTESIATQIVWRE